MKPTGIAHLSIKNGRYYLFRRVPMDVRPYYVERGRTSTHVKEGLGTGNLREAERLLPAAIAKYNAEWERIRRLRAESERPAVFDEIDEATAKALVWKSWLAWEALGLGATMSINEFTPWVLKTLPRLPPGIEHMTARQVRAWHDDFHRQREVRLLTPFAQTAVAREIPAMLPVLHAMPTLDLGQSRLFSPGMRKPLMLKELMDKFHSSHRRENLKDVTRSNYTVPFDILLDLLGGERPITHIGREDILEVVEVMRYLPRYAKQRPEFKELGYRQIAELTRERVADGDTSVELVKRSAVNKYLMGVTTLFTFAMTNQLIVSHPAKDITFLGVAQSEKRAFTLAELQRLFHRGYRVGPLNWIPLVCLFQCLRPNEAAQLDVEDVARNDAGTWCLYISVARPFTSNGKQVSDDKTLKTAFSRRTIPLHRRLIELGFLDYVDERRKATRPKLFDVARYGQSPYYYDSVRKPLAELLQAAGVRNHGETSMHSFRHTAADAIRATGAPQQIREAIGGWSLSGSAEIGYGHADAFSPEALKAWLDRIDFPGLFTKDPPQGWAQVAAEVAVG
ncbi:MAG: DUF6538 domain-containing protein [Actinomycetota bacterium]